VKKRVLQLIGSFHQGGSESQAVELARRLRDEGSFDVFAATLNGDGVLRSRMDDAGFNEIPEFPLTSFYNANFVRQTRRCADHLRGNKIDIVHTHDFYTNVFGMAAARLANVSVRISSKRETSGMRSRAQEFVEDLAFRQAHAIVVNSSAVRDHLVKCGLATEKIHTICNGIDVDRFNLNGQHVRSVPTEWNVPADAPLITMVANLRHSVKNVPMFIQAARRVLEVRPDVHFIVAGEGELRSKFERSAENSGVANKVHFLGRCDDVPFLLNMSFACVLTSFAEGFSNSILEYMAAGKPVVATDVGGASDAIVAGETGYLVPSDDDEALATRIIQLLNDEAKAIAFGTEGRRVVSEKFSPHAQLRSTVDLYNSLLKLTSRINAA